MKKLVLSVAFLCALATAALAQQTTVSGTLRNPDYAALLWLQTDRDEGAQIIGSYKIGGEYGDPSQHAATYVLRFGNPNDGKQFAFGGFVQYLLDELNLPTAETYSGVRVSRGLMETVDVEFTPGSSGCFGGRVKVLAIQPVN
jgi:hypothetical protein